MSRTMCAAAALAMASSFVLPTVAQAETPTSVEVSYADLDLTRAGDATILAKRIDRAARQVCGDRSSRDLKVVRQVNACRVEAIASARPQIDAAVRAASARVELLAHNKVRVNAPPSP